MHANTCCFLPISPREWHVSLDSNKSKVLCCGAQPASSASRAPFLLEMYGLQYTVPMNAEARILRGVNFGIRERQFIIIVGENGAGKSTLLKMMIGMMAPNKGRFIWKGQEVRRKKLIDGIGIVMQRPGDFFLANTVLDELVMGRDHVRPDDVRRVLLSVGLGNISLLNPPKQLSGGQMKRLAIADQLLRKPQPELLLLDEPMAGVDAKGRRQLTELLSSLSTDMALVVVSHEPDELLQYADRVVQLARGRILEVNQAVIKRALKLNRKEISSANDKC